MSDGSGSYKVAIDADLGPAKNVLDRFDAIRWFAEVCVPKFAATT